MVKSLSLSDWAVLVGLLAFVPTILINSRARDAARVMWERLRPDADLVPGVVLVSVPDEAVAVMVEALRREGLRYDEPQPARRSESEGTDTQPPTLIVVRPERGREFLAVRALRDRRSDPSARRSQILVSRVPRIHMESPTAPAPSFTRLSNLDAALQKARAMAAPISATNTRVMVIDRGFDTAILESLNPDDADQISRLPMVWPGPRPRDGRCNDRHGTAVVIGIHAVEPTAQISWLPLPDEEDRPDWFAAVLDEVGQQQLISPSS